MTDPAEARWRAAANTASCWRSWAGLRGEPFFNANRPEHLVAAEAVLDRWPEA